MCGWFGFLAGVQLGPVLVAVVGGAAVDLAAMRFSKFMVFVYDVALETTAAVVLYWSFNAEQKMYQVLMYVCIVVSEIRSQAARRSSRGGKRRGQARQDSRTGQPAVHDSTSDGHYSQTTRKIKIKHAQVSVQRCSNKRERRTTAAAAAASAAAAALVRMQASNMDPRCGQTKQTSMLKVITARTCARNTVFPQSPHAA